MGSVLKLISSLFDEFNNIHEIKKNEDERKHDEAPLFVTLN